MNDSDKRMRKARPWVVLFSIVIPLAVASLFSVNIEGYDTSFLPPVYATINAITALILIAGVIAIRNKQVNLHHRLMKTAIVLSALFLLLYLIYHATSESTPFGGEGTIRLVYFALLISHILLSVTVIPLVMITYIRAWAGRYDLHRKIARVTFPVWLYVAVSGVLVYILISPYYV